MRFIHGLMLTALFLSTCAPGPIQAHDAAANLRLSFSGNAVRADGHRLHYAVTVFRYVPGDAGLSIGERRRATVFIATCTLTDDAAPGHLIAQRFGRTRFGDVTADGHNATIDVGGWFLRARDAHGVITVHLRLDDARMRLELDARGRARVGTPFVPPMQTSGHIDDAAVRGYSTLAVDTRPELVGGPRGDRFIATVHITGARGIHTIRMTRFGSRGLVVASIIDPDGRVRRLKPGEIDVVDRPNSTWISPDSSYAYQALWLVTIRPLGAWFSLSPALMSQEFTATPRTDTFWEGAVLVQPLDPYHQVFGRGTVVVGAAAVARELPPAR